VNFYLQSCSNLFTCQACAEIAKSLSFDAPDDAMTCDESFSINTTLESTKLDNSITMSTTPIQTLSLVGEFFCSQDEILRIIEDLVNYPNALDAAQVEILVHSNTLSSM